MIYWKTDALWFDLSTVTLYEKKKKKKKERVKFFVSEYYSSEVYFHNSKFHALDLIILTRV